jgi:hypothetical protein
VFATKLKESLKVENLKPGEAVEFESVEATLIPGPTVIPAKAIFHGEIVNASSTKGRRGLESRVSVIISSVTWKDRSLPLCATITGFGERTIKIVTGPRQRPITTPLPNNSPNDNWRVDAFQQDDLATHFLEDSRLLAGQSSSPDSVLVMHPDAFVREISLIRTPSGATELVREGKKLHLSSGMLIALSPIGECSF